MNKVFRVIWSEAQGAWVAVSETTKSHSKRSRKSALALALTAGSLMTISGTAVAKGTFVASGEASIAINSGTCNLATAADGKNSVSIGCGAGAGAEGEFTGSKADSDTSIGYQAGIGVKGKENTAIGSNAGENVTGNDNTAFGVSAGKLVTGSKNVSLGFNSGFQLNGNSNISAGDASGGSIYGDNNVMLGTGAKVKGSAAGNRISDTVLIGTRASASSSDNVAIGKDTQATHANSVALGHASVTSEAKAITEGSIVDSAGTTHTYSGFAGVGSEANGVVSVGALNAERQIVNVAAGAITSASTDAVNGSQLYGVAKGLNDQVNDLGSSVAGSLGGGSKYEGGKVSADLTVGGKNYTNVQDALNNIGGGWVLGSKAADGTTDQDLTIATGKKVDFNAGKNMEITSEQDADGNVVSTFKTKDDVAFTSVTTGGTVMNDNGLTITNGPSITKTGINAGDLNITNVKAGIADTDGVNVSQLQGVANVIGGVTVDANGNYTGPTFKVNNTTNTTIAGAIAELDKGWTFTAGGETDQVQAGDKVSLEAGKNMLITSTKDANGNITSTFLTKDVVEFDSVKTGDSLLNNTGLTVGTNVSVTNQGFTAGDVSLTVGGINAGNQTITNVAPGEISDTSLEAINGSQLHATNNRVTVNEGNISNLDGRVTVNEGDITTLKQGWTLSDGTDTQNVKAGDTATIKAGDNMEVAFDAKGDMIVKTQADVKFDTVTTGNTVMNTDGLTIGPVGAGQVIINKDQISVGGNQINNVKAGTQLTDGVNVSQLKGVANVIGGVTVDIDGNYTGPTFNVNKTEQTTITGAIAELDKGWTLSDGTVAGTTQVKAGDKIAIQGSENIDVTLDATSGEMVVKTNPNVTHTSVTTGDTVMNDNGLTITNGPSITKTGIDAGNQTITNVAPGEISDTSLEAINGSQLHATNNRVTVNEGNISNLDGRVTVNEGDITTLQQGWTLSDGTDTQNVKAGDTATIKAGDNMEVAFDDDGDMIVKTQADVKFDSVTLGDIAQPDQYTQLTQDGLNIGGNTFVNNGGLTFKGSSVAVSASGINAGGNKIINVAKGVADTDAVNVSQLETVATTAGQGWYLKVNDAELANVAQGETMGLTAGKNMVLNQTGTSVEFTTKDEVDFTSVTTGDTVMNTDGLTLGDIAQPDQYTQLTQDGLNIGGNTFVNNGGLTFKGSSVAVSASGINAGGNKIINVAKGVADTDAVNVSQLETVAATAGQGWYLKVNDADLANVAQGETMGLTAGKNMVLNQTGTSVEFTTKDEVDFTSVTTGDTVMNTDGLTLGDIAQPDQYTQLTQDGLNIGGNTFVNNGGLTFKGSSVAVSASGINAGGNKIINVAKGVADTDAVNVSQLETVAATAGQGWYLKVNDADLANVAQGETMGLTAGKNMVLTQTGTSVEFTTKDEVDFTTVTTGDTVMSDNGLTIVGGPSITKAGINAGNLNITNVKAGTADTHGVNVSQLKGLGSVIGDITIDNSTGAVTGPTFNVNNTENTTIAGAIAELDKGWTLSDGTNTKTIKAGDTATIKAGDNMDVAFDTNGDMIVKTKDAVNFTTVTTGNTVMNNNGLTITGGPSFTKTEINAGGLQIHNVEAGVAPTDAVNVSQLESVKDIADNANKGWNVSVDGGAAHNVAPDTAVDFKGGKNIELTQNGGEITIDTAAEVEFDDVKVGDVTINQDTGITVGDTKINKDGVKVGDVSITAGGINAGGTKITGVADGLIAKDSKDAVNGGQIHDMQVQIDQQAGGWELNDGKGGKQQVKAGDSVAIVGGDNINVEFDADGKMVVETTPDVTHNSVNIESTDANGNIVKGPSMNKDGIDAANKKITSVAKGEVSETSTDAINGSQLDATNNRVTNIEEGKDGMFQVHKDYEAKDKPKPTGVKSVAGGAGAVASGDNSAAIGNGAQATKENSTALGNGASANENNSVALGQGSVADRENSVSVGTVGGERQITNVAAGVAPTDAVNVSQLDALGSKVNQYFNAANKRIDKVDNNARAGIAAAMAAGTLPQSTLPGKSMVTVGASTYRGESALAIGVSRLSDNARTVIKANASADSRGNAGAAVGAGWHW